MASDHCQSVLTMTSLLWRILGSLGLLDTIYNHVSHSWVSDDGQLQLTMNPNGLLPQEVLSDKLKTIPLRKYDSGDAAEFDLNPDGLRLHSALQTARARPGVIVHTHSRHTIAVGAIADGLLPISQTAIEFAGEMRVLTYAGMLRDAGDSEELLQLACNGGAALLQNHGAIVVTDTVEEALYLTYFLEEACRIQVLTLSQNRALLLPPAEVISCTHDFLLACREKEAIRLFDAFTRQLTAGEA